MQNSSPENNLNKKREYVTPKIEDLGAIAEITRNGFSKGNDVGLGKSGAS